MPVSGMPSDPGMLMKMHILIEFKRVDSVAVSKTNLLKSNTLADFSFCHGL
jgi:hypothetical protein